MANCAEIKKGDVYVCETCGLELQVSKTCSCGSGSGDTCSVPLQCCGKNMVKKQPDCDPVAGSVTYRGHGSQGAELAEGDTGRKYAKLRRTSPKTQIPPFAYKAGQL